MTENPPPQKTITRTYENSWGKRHSLLIKLLAIILLVLLCCTISYTLSVKALHWKICKGPERTELFWQICKEEQEALLLKTCVEVDRNVPPNTEVLVSACVRPSATGVPGGEILFVHEGLTDKMYLLDLRTGEKRDVPNDPLLLDHGVFLSPELVWLDGGFSRPESPGYRPHYILDLTDGQRYELLDLTWLPRLEGSKFDPKYYAYFQSAEQVFIYHTGNTLIALSSDFQTNQNGRVVFSKQSNTFENGELLVQLMKDLGVEYEIVDFSLQYADVPSPTGKYVVRNDGIYLSKTNMPVVTGYMKYYFRGWYYDESGVVVKERTTYLISSSLLGSHYPIPTPILKLRLPAP